MKEHIRPKFDQMVQPIEQYCQDKRHLSRKDFVLQITMDKPMKVFLSLLMDLCLRKENDYKAFALQHSKGLFQIDQMNNENASNIDREE